jgi:hypothetical protein
VIPHALGQAVRFAAGEGPRLDPITDGRTIKVWREKSTRPCSARSTRLVEGSGPSFGPRPHCWAFAERPGRSRAT